MIYKKMPINTDHLKFISGQLLFIINNYIKNKFENNEKKSSEIKYLLYHFMEDKLIKFILIIFIKIKIISQR